MAGKSTYIRQVALIVLLGQIGSFVPAESAEIGIGPIAFSPELVRATTSSRVRSTFMVEMTETALIANNATEHSLVILDEIGRGNGKPTTACRSPGASSSIFTIRLVVALFSQHTTTSFTPARRLPGGSEQFQYRRPRVERSDHLSSPDRSRGPLIRATASRSLDSLACRILSFPGPKRFSPVWKGETSLLRNPRLRKKRATRREPEEEGDDPQMMLFG